MAVKKQHGDDLTSVSIVGFSYTNIIFSQSETDSRGDLNASKSTVQRKTSFSFFIV